MGERPDIPADIDARHRLLIGSWAQAVWETDGAGVVVTDSPSWRAYTGQTLEQWLGYGWLDAIHPDDRSYAEQQWRDAVAARRLVDAEFRLRAPDGGWRWTNVRAAPVIDAEGRVEKWLGLNIDIDDRKRAEQALRESEARYHQLFVSTDSRRRQAEAALSESEQRLTLAIEGSKIAVYECDLDLRYTWIANPAEGWRPSDLLGRTDADLLPPEQAGPLMAFKRRALVADGPLEEEVAGAPSGVPNWFLMRAEKLSGADGAVTGLRVLALDITAQKVVEAALRESEQRQALLLAVGDAMRAVPTAAGKIDAAARLLGERLGASRVLYSEYDWSRNIAHTFGGWIADGAEPFPTIQHLDDYDGEVLNELKAGRTVRVDNVGLRLAEPAYAAIAAVGVQALLSPPLMIDGRLTMNLSIHQHDPRHWTDAEVRLVEEVAERLWAEVVRARAEDAVRDSEERLGLAIEIGGTATWDWDVRTGEVAWSDRHFLMQGYAIGEVTPSFDAWASRVHPEDLEVTVAKIERARAMRDVYVHEFRALWPDGTVRWCSARGRFFYGFDGEAERMIGVMEDVTERKAVEQARREAEARQAFLLTLSDALRPLADAEDIRSAACRLLGERLGAARTYFVAYEEELGYGLVSDDYLVPGLQSLAGRYPFETFRSTYERLSSGRTWIVQDVRAAEELPASERDYYAAQGVVAWVDVPLAKAGALEAALCVVQTEARAWTSAEIALIEETAERLWAALQRGRAETALRESEARFQQFARASAAGLWIRDAETLEMEFVSPSVGEIYGVETDALIGDVKRWGAMIVPEDRDSALEHVEAARRGETTTFEFRIQRPSDQAFRWIRSTDFPLLDGGKVRRIGGIAEDITDTRRLVEHQGVLVAELQHRVRNIMGVIRSVANRTAAGSGSAEAYRERLEGRLMALGRVQALLTREVNAGGSLCAILKSELEAQAHHRGQLELTGPDVPLSPKAVEVLTLAFHELATNAVKYGALSAPEGRVAVNWRPIERSGACWLALDWVERGGPAPSPSARRGFGSELIEARIPYELGGSGKITVAPDGAQCHLEFPLLSGESILATDAPHPATVFGGILDMTGAPDLSGRRVLVVEDDYYLAADSAAALRGAGAEVLGPCPTVEATLELLSRETPTHAVLDLNLGSGGPEFEIAHRLKQQGVPMLFLTGYDPDVIPEDLRGVTRLQKPASFSAIVEAVSQL